MINLNFLFLIYSARLYYVEWQFERCYKKQNKYDKKILVSDNASSKKFIYYCSVVYFASLSFSWSSS